MNTQARMTSLNKFRTPNYQGRGRVLIIFDLHVKVTDIGPQRLVINYDLPRSVEGYAQRVSTAMSNGHHPRPGVVVNLIQANGGDVEMLRSIECAYKFKCSEVSLSSFYLCEDPVLTLLFLISLTVGSRQPARGPLDGRLRFLNVSSPQHLSPFKLYRTPTQPPSYPPLHHSHPLRSLHHNKPSLFVSYTPPPSYSNPVFSCQRSTTLFKTVSP